MSYLAGSPKLRLAIGSQASVACGRRTVVALAPRFAEAAR